MNPEDAVIAQIDTLIDAQLERGPRDDYTVDRYPRCDDCNHHWHGVGCVYCDCPGLTGEPGGEQPHYLDQIESVRLAFVAARGYTIADLEAMRWNREVHQIYRAQLGPEGLTTGLQ